MSRRFIEIAALTDAGSVRQFNEDAIVADPEAGVAVLADGMGGHRAGGVASRMAAQVIFEALLARVAEFRSRAGPHASLQAVEKSINQANEAVFHAGQSQPSYHGMGTTLAVTPFHDNRVVLRHIGDSRIFVDDADIELIVGKLRTNLPLTAGQSIGLEARALRQGDVIEVADAKLALD